MAATAVSSLNLGIEVFPLIESSPRRPITKPTATLLAPPSHRLPSLIFSNPFRLPLLNHRRHVPNSLSTTTTTRGTYRCCEVLSSLTLTDEDLDKLGFEKVAEEFIGECKSEVLLLRHKKTGAQVASMSNNDENKVFGIVFRTPLHERQTFLQPSTRGFGGVVQAGVTDIKLVSHGFLSCGGDVTVKLVQLKDHQR
ncbi:hypothetical protein FF1_040884 [Malus domestica]